MNKVPSLTIGVAAYNEKANIKQMLTSVLSQDRSGYTIEKIIVISDGSIDNTATLVRSIKSSLIKLVASKTNKGYTSRWNQLMKTSKSDILLFLDADELLSNKFAIAEIIKQFDRDPKITLVGGNPFSVGSGSFFEKSLAVARDIYTDVRYKINQGNNIFGCMGGMLAVSKKLYKKVVIPPEIFANDAYLYLSCVSRNQKFVNAKNALIVHQFPKSLQQYLSRIRKHKLSQRELRKYFPSSLINKEYFLPKSLLISAALTQLVKHPLETLFMVFLNRYAAYVTQ